MVSTLKGKNEMPRGCAQGGLHLVSAELSFEFRREPGLEHLQSVPSRGSRKGLIPLEEGPKAPGEGKNTSGCNRRMLGKVQERWVSLGP